MCVIEYLFRFNKVPNKENNAYLNDVSLTYKVKRQRQDYKKLLLSLHKNVYEHKPPASVINASNCYVDDNNDILKFVEEIYQKTSNNKNFILFCIKIIDNMNKQN